MADSLFSIGGGAVTADQAALDTMAAWLRDRHGRGVSGALLYAAAASHELQHLILLELRASGDLDVEALFAEPATGDQDRLLAAFPGLFPPGSNQAQAEPLSTREELLLLCLHNSNPAFAELRPLLDDRELREFEAYRALEHRVHEVAGAGTDHDSLSGQLKGLRRLMAAQLAQPGSLLAQLQWLEQFEPALRLAGAAGLAERLLMAADMLREEAAPHFSGGFQVQAPELSGSLLELSGSLDSASDSDWMRDTVISARNCLVWLEQLSQRYGRQITRLDEIPEEELAGLAETGVNGLWLIGMWERSKASRLIKRRRGQPDAAASAYSISDYTIGEQLGGEEALAVLKERALRHGLRLVADMVPNHTAIDSRWVTEHPDWFMQLPEPPFPGYGFNGPDLSEDDRVAIRLEDHYWDGSDAAVVFQRTDTGSGETRYIYHGNDGTGLPWNDTAQLDYLNAVARQAVIDTMVAVARKFPVIRFDAAMTLVRRHIQRLWYPPAGQGGAIASRARHGSMPAAEFEARLPQEFWREATTALAREAPDTLLIAEAFWMLEGYFVRNLGMHRVYNSAFMHMLRDGDNEGFRSFLKDALLTDPAVLGRFVNYMSNPDEESARGQFGTGDRYFGVCTLLVTLPGLPLLAHGQVEGLSEKYGMEFTGPRLAEQPDRELIRGHEQQIFPLLSRRTEFSGTDGFELHDFSTHYGVDENVIAFSNRHGHGASLVVYNNRYALADGVILQSVERLRPGSDAASAVPLAEALGFSGDSGVVSWRNQRTGLTHLKQLSSLNRQGLPFSLAAFESAVLLDFRLHDGAEYVQLEQELAGTGVSDLTAALQDLQVRPVRDWLLGLPARPGLISEVPEGLDLPDSALLRLADRSRRLGAHLSSENSQPARAWELLDGSLRSWLLCQGIDGLADLPDRLAPGRPDWTRSLPGRSGPDWWNSAVVRSALQFHEAGGTDWFVQEPFDRLVATLYVRALLRAGEEAAAELNDALLAARDFSGWKPARLLRALGVRSGE